MTPRLEFVGNLIRPCPINISSGHGCEPDLPPIAFETATEAL